MMLGKDIVAPGPAVTGEEEAAGEVLLTFRGMGKAGSVTPFDLDIRKGEVVGIAGF